MITSDKCSRCGKLFVSVRGTCSTCRFSFDSSVEPGYSGIDFSMTAQDETVSKSSYQGDGGSYGGSGASDSFSSSCSGSSSGSSSSDSGSCSSE